MDQNWSDLKSTIKRAYMSECDDSVLRRDSKAYEDFWNFFRKYRSAVENKGRKLFGPDSTLPARAGKLPVTVTLSKACRNIARTLPRDARDEFEFILRSYIIFRQKEFFGKLKKLRKTQAELPIRTHKDEILGLISKNSILVVAGDTGCGKSTQLPQYLLEAGYENIVCTQPRRIACISLSNRVAFETLHEYGTRVAYQIRFERTRTLATRLLFMTEGLLLRQLTSETGLSGYNVIILDEVHERHLQGDFLMGLLKDEVKRRKDLKLILMSATINIEKFAKYFEGAPVVQVPGRLYPIKLIYKPPPPKEAKFEVNKSEERKIDTAPYLNILQQIDAKYPSKERGDVLVFLSGISEIQTVADALKPYAEHTKRWIILMLHSTLSLEEQDKVFDISPEGVRKAILSTNIAETSITIDGIRFVIDSGKVKEMVYDPASLMHCLKERWISKASAEQRKGRAGRTGPGTCFRLYSDKDFGQFDAFNRSEIHRTSLDSLVLQMISLGIKKPENFNFIEPPSPDKLHESLESLRDQESLDLKNNLTPLGRMLVKLPVEVPIGKMLLLGCAFHQVETVLTLAAELSVQSPFTNRSFRDLDMINKRQELMSNHGDPFTLLNVYREWLEVKGQRGSSRRWCRDRGIEEQRLYEITKLRNQFKDLLTDGDLIEKARIEGDSHDRKVRKGEMKRLADLKRKTRNVQRQRKVLKLNEMEIIEQSAEQEQEEAPDVHALEFSMKHTHAELHDNLRHYDLEANTTTLLKVIVCSSLYPRYALLDQHNTYRQGADILAHSKPKTFVHLHPNSTLGQEPDILGHQLGGSTLDESPLHQLIFYTTLLETNKPFLINSLRVPALHTLLLVARTIHTNADCTRILADSWLDLRSTNASSMQYLIFGATQIRDNLAKSLERKLAGDFFSSKELVSWVIDYFREEVSFSIKQLHRVDLGSIFVGPGGSMTPLPGSLGERFPHAHPDPETGGLRLTDYLCYGSIVDESLSKCESDHYLIVAWTCPNCETELHVSPIQKIEHLQSCSKIEETEMDDAPDRPNTKSYFCELCNEKLQLTPIEFLKHKRQHAKDS